MRLQPLTLMEAQEIVRWKYEGEHAFYDGEDHPEVIRELLDGSYYAARNRNGEFLGFYCYGRNAQVPAGRDQGLYEGDGVLDIGLGMKPELTGRGGGAAFLKVGMQFAQEEWRPRRLRLTVATFNLRAIRLYAKSGFREVGLFDNAGTAFQIMELPFNFD